MGNLPLAERTIATAISANGVDALLQQREDSAADPLVVYFHGGGYAVASALAYRSYCSHLVKRPDGRAYARGSRTPPIGGRPITFEPSTGRYSVRR